MNSINNFYLVYNFLVNSFANFRTMVSYIDTLYYYAFFEFFFVFLFYSLLLPPVLSAFHA